MTIAGTTRNSRVIGARPPDGKPFSACFQLTFELQCNYNNMIASMVLNNAQKQARYRERHLAVDGKKVRVQLFLSATTRAQLGRLAKRKGYTVTYLVEELAASAERRVTARLSGKALKAYLDRE